MRRKRSGSATRQELTISQGKIHASNVVLRRVGNYPLQRFRNVLKRCPPSAVREDLEDNQIYFGGYSRVEAVRRTNDSCHMGSVACAILSGWIICTEKIVLINNTVSYTIAIRIWSEKWLIEINTSINDYDCITVPIDTNKACILVKIFYAGGIAQICVAHARYRYIDADSPV